VARIRAGTAARPLLVVVGSGPVVPPVCSTRGGSMFEELAAAFTVGGPGSPSTGRDESGGVLREVKKKIRQLPGALPKPPAAGFSDSRPAPALLIAIAVALLALSGGAAIAYVVRYLRRPPLYF
jgi:hypothetical protein